MDSAYFCLTSLLKIGLGDFVPGSSKAGSLNMQLYVDYCYLLFGMGIIAMNYYLNSDVRLPNELLHMASEKSSTTCAGLAAVINMCTCSVSTNFTEAWWDLTLFYIFPFRVI